MTAAVQAGAELTKAKDGGPTPIPATDSPPASTRHPVLAMLGLVTVLGAVIVGGPWGVRERLVDLATSKEETAPIQQWQSVVSLRGTGTMDSAPFSIAPGTKGWRVRWTCQTGRLAVSQSDRPGRLFDSACPSAGAQAATGSGQMNLQVIADGPWQLDVERQSR